MSFSHLFQQKTSKPLLEKERNLSYTPISICMNVFFKKKKDPSNYTQCNRNSILATKSFSF